MISEKIQDAFNKQLNAETYSGYLYLSMAACFEACNLPGFARWMKVQAQEEMGHAMKFYAHINERGGRVKLDGIDAPPVEWDSPLAAFQAAYEHEQKVTAMINDLVDLAAKESDHAAGVFLQWFVSEQVEEEASADEIVQMLKRIQDAPGPLYMLDHQLGQRGAGGE